MRKIIASLLFAACLFGAVSGLSQTVVCSDGGFTLTLPDDFAEIPVTSADDRDLVLRYTDGALDLAVYVSFTGTDSPFLVLTGDELEYGPVVIDGMTMQYARGLDDQGSWITYSWLRARDAVTLYFIWTGNDDAALALINEIMSTITFG